MKTYAEVPIIISDSKILQKLKPSEVRLLNILLDDSYQLPTRHAFLILQLVNKIMHYLNIYAARHLELMPEYDILSRIIEKRIDQLTNTVEQ
jgi:hypothetical protein